MIVCNGLLSFLILIESTESNTNKHKGVITKIVLLFIHNPNYSPTFALPKSSFDKSEND